MRTARSRTAKAGKNVSCTSRSLAAASRGVKHASCGLAAASRSLTDLTATPRDLTAWARERVAKTIRDQSGQSSVEYAVVLAGVLSVLVCLLTLANAIGDGEAAQTVVASLTHRLAKGVLDVFAF